MSRYKVIKVLQKGQPTFPCILESASFDKIGNKVGKGDFEYSESLIRELANYYHLYIVDTQATIEHNDWYMRHDYPQICGFMEQGTIVDNKIIASTDASLGLPFIPQHLIGGVIQHGVDNILIEDCYYAGDVFTVKWADKLTKTFDSLSQTVKDIRAGVLNPVYNTNKPEIDFELLKDFISGLKAFGKSEKYANSIRNAVLFFELEEVKQIITHYENI